MGVLFLSRHEGHDIERLAICEMGHMQSSTFLDSILRFSGFATMSASRIGDTLVRCDLTRPGKLLVTLLLNIILRLETPSSSRADCRYPSDNYL